MFAAIWAQSLLASPAAAQSPRTGSWPGSGIVVRGPRSIAGPAFQPRLSLLALAPSQSPPWGAWAGRNASGALGGPTIDTCWCCCAKGARVTTWTSSTTASRPIPMPSTTRPRRSRLSCRSWQSVAGRWCTLLPNSWRALGGRARAHCLARASPGRDRRRPLPDRHTSGRSRHRGAFASSPASEPHRPSRHRGAFASSRGLRRVKHGPADKKVLCAYLEFRYLFFGITSFTHPLTYSPIQLTVELKMLSSWSRQSRLPRLSSRNFLRRLPRR